MLSRLQRRKAGQLFERFDRDGSGALTYGDFYDVARETVRRTYPDPGELERHLRTVDADLKPWWDFITRLDRNADGEVSLDEWLRGYEDFVMKDVAGFGSVLLKISGTWFENADVDHDGLLTYDEYLSLFAVPGIQTPQEARAAFTRMDSRGTGQVSKAQYILTVYDFFVGDDAGTPGAVFMGDTTKPA
ncbi:EF-hand domain-containing protein [Streptomyces sp. 4F14]|uniref:EF-hand domain-containing protein n=1 Tax=Streptomyces sp. 4F14 TaxID=3394380 RepID=UPI003A88BE2B